MLLLFTGTVPRAALATTTIITPFKNTQAVVTMAMELELELELEPEPEPEPAPDMELVQDSAVDLVED